MDKEIIKIASQLGQVLKYKNLKITTAESCTGGGVAKAITEISGSSVWFDMGFVTYSNQAKKQMLQVCQSTLNDFGAVSSQVVIEMAGGALDKSGADLAVAVTGIAGPEGGTDQKPVGTVYIGWAIKGRPAGFMKYVFVGDRKQVRQQTISHALKHCLQVVL